MWYKEAQFFSEFGTANTASGQLNAGQPSQQWRGWQAPNATGMQQKGQPVSQNQSLNNHYDSMIQAMREGRMPVRSGDGGVAYLEKGLWSTQKPEGFGAAQYTVMFSNGSMQQSWIMPEALKQGMQFNASDFNDANRIVQTKGVNVNNAIVKIDQGTYVYIPTAYCTLTQPPVGANWYQYQTMDGRIVYGAPPEVQTSRAQQITDAKLNPKQTVNDPLSQYTQYMQSVLKSYQKFDNEYQKAMSNQSSQSSQARSNEEPTMGHMHPRHPGGRPLPNSG